jgi:Protein of unknown function (DUF3093)
VAEHQPDREGVLYEERQWSPWWVYALAFTIGPAFVISAAVLGDLTGAPFGWTIGLSFAVGMGVICAAVIWGVSLRKLTVQSGGLRLGRRWIPFSDVESARYVDHEEAQRIAKTMKYTPLLPSTYGQRKRQWGSRRQPWMKDAILVHLKPGSPAITDDWLIGTRHPQQLIELFQTGIAQAPSTSSAPADVAASPA